MFGRGNGVALLCGGGAMLFCGGGAALLWGGGAALYCDGGAIGGSAGDWVSGAGIASDGAAEFVADGAEPADGAAPDEIGGMLKPPLEACIMAACRTYDVDVDGAESPIAAEAVRSKFCWTGD